MKFSKNFSLAEMVYSATAEHHKLDNTPSEAQIANLKALAIFVLQPLRDLLERPILINSAFRSLAINKLVGGVEWSQHRCLGLSAAADITVKGMKPRELFDFIIKHADQIPFDQVILEFGAWVHISYKRDKEGLVRAGRGIKLIATRDKGKVIYTAVA